MINGKFQQKRNATSDTNKTIKENYK